MRYGSGLQNKLLEAFAVSCPVITTPKGFEGLRGKPGKHLVIAKESEFPQQVIKLLSDESLRDKIAANGRKIVESNYRWPLIESKLDECVREVF
jgi:glycosyltransferase involved in cell wall biosynthesis